jgi:hypothetical protein
MTHGPAIRKIFPSPIGTLPTWKEFAKECTAEIAEIAENLISQTQKSPSRR